MKPGNYLAIALLCGTLFFERLAYYGFRATLFLRLREEFAMTPKDVGTLMSAGSALLLFGFLVGGGLSTATRSRFVMLGAVALLGLAHGAAAVSPGLGSLAIALVSGIVRPLTFMALAEEIDREGRVWKAVVVSALIAFIANLAASLGAAAGAAQHARGSTHAIPALVMVVAVMAVAGIAFGLPGQPFRWDSPEVLLPGQSGMYRPEPRLVRAASGPNPLILALVGVALGLSACEQGFQSHAFYQEIYRSNARVSTLSTIAQVGNPAVVCLVGLALAGVAGSLASQRSTLSPAWLLGAGLGALGVSTLVMAGAVVVRSSGLSLLSMLVDGFGEGLFLPVAMAYALATLPSRWAGLSGAGYSVALYLPSLIVNVVAPMFQRGLPLALGAVGVLTVLGAAVVLVLGPKLERVDDVARVP